ncbi:MAG: sodium-dependent transporter [Eubacteriales bacterium]|nr:sodium-dependent transporter [Eubacteriales bacterium]
MENKSFASRLGFILVSAGCAVGIGNVWKFPYVTGQNGGAIFVLLYLLFLCILGVPVMTMELAIGRASRASIVNGYKKLERPGEKWHLHGWVCILGCLLLMMYYTTVSGWMIAYAVKFATGTFEGAAQESVDAVFGALLASPTQMVGFMAVVVVFGFVVISFGVQKGLEKVNKFMMIGLMLLIIVLAVRTVTLPGASAGISFYLKPNLQATMEIGIGNVIVAAMNQAFFTLSLGVAALEIFGSYMSDKHSLTGEAVRIGALDTFVALMAGLIIFPACASFGISPDAGPSLIFITLPSVFVNMSGGRLWGTLFFVFMTFASFSTVTAVFENLVASISETFRIERKKSILYNFLAVFILSIPCALGYNVLSNIRFFGGRDILDFEDFLVSNLILPIGAVVFVLFCTHRFGWGFDNYLAETNKGKGMKMPAALKFYFQFVLPLLVIFILIKGLI